MKFKVCNTNKEDDNCQKFPNNGILGDNKNKTCKELINLLNEENNEAEIRTYLFSTIDLIEGKFYQTGGAPNWQGDYITLCTCKHMMRTAKKTEDWKDVWIAGLKLNEKDNNSAYLVYLMKIQNGYKSMFHLWDSLNSKVREEKSSREKIFGDLYEPRYEKIIKENDESIFNPCNYWPPIEGHVHYHSWWEDIHYYDENTKRFSSYLLGIRDKSFLWNKPKILVSHPKGKKFTQSGYGKEWKLSEFCEYIRPVKK